LKLNPNFINAIHGLATTYLAQSQISIARQLLDKSILKYPDIPIFHADLAKALEKLGLRKEARQSWQQVIKLAPESELTKEAVNELTRLSSGFDDL